MLRFLARVEKGSKIKEKIRKPREERGAKT
jgi:hypothetical protein